MARIRRHMAMMSSTQCGPTWQQHIKFSTLCPVPNVKKLMDSLLKKRQREHFPKCEELDGKATKNYGYDVLGCGKRYTTEVALNTHKDDPDKIVSDPELQYICEHCAKDFTTKGSLTRHIKRKHSSKGK